MKKLLCTWLNLHTYSIDKLIREELNDGHYLEITTLKCDYCRDERTRIKRKPISVKDATV